MENQLLQMTIDGLLMGSVYALIAVGLTLIWGVMDIINFAHGAFLMLAMFGTFWADKLWGIDPLISLPFVAVILFFIGWGTYSTTVRKVLTGPILAQLLVTFGIGIFLVNLAVFLWSPDYRQLRGTLVSGTWHFPLFVASEAKVIAALASVVVFAGTYWWLKKTRLGRAVQATSISKEAALLMGINTERVFGITFGVALALLGVAGSLLSNFYYVFPSVGDMFCLLAFAIVALGGFGSVPGSFLGGLMIGLAENIGGLYLGPQYKDAIIFAIYLGVVMVRPKGLFGW